MVGDPFLGFARSSEGYNSVLIAFRRTALIVVSPVLFHALQLIKSLGRCIWVLFVEFLNFSFTIPLNHVVCPVRDEPCRRREKNIKARRSRYVTQDGLSGIPIKQTRGCCDFISPSVDRFPARYRSRLVLFSEGRTHRRFPLPVNDPTTSKGASLQRQV